MVWDRVVSFSPRRALRTQSGSSTPNPAPESNGPVSFRNRNAPGVSSSTTAGAASRNAPSISPNNLAAAPSPASSSSAGSVPPETRARPVNPEPRPAHTSAAEIMRLGSSADCSANSTRQGSKSGAPGSPGSPGSVSRKQVRTGPAGIRAPSSQASSSAASCCASASSCGVTTAMPASVADRAATNRSAIGMRAGVRPRLVGRREAVRRARAAASVRDSSAPASSGPGACPPPTSPSLASARHDGGIAAARS